MTHLTEGIANLNNWIKDNKHCILSSTECRKVLGDCKLPKNLSFWTIFSKTSSIIIKVGWNQYRFRSDLPINIKYIENVYKAYRDSVDNRTKASEEKEAKVLEKKAIEYLKSRGYIIFKQL